MSCALQQAESSRDLKTHLNGHRNAFPVVNENDIGVERMAQAYGAFSPLSRSAKTGSSSSGVTGSTSSHKGKACAHARTDAGVEG